MRRPTAIALILLFSQLLPSSAYSASPSSTCSKKGIERVISGERYICSGKKRLTWRKSVRPTPTAPSMTPSPVPSKAPSPTPSPIPSPTSIPSESPKTPAISGSELLLSADKCRLRVPEDPVFALENFGFPKAPELLNSKGTHKILAINVDFSNFRAQESTVENTAPYAELFERYWTNVSRGEINFKVETLGSWISLPKTTFEYAGPAPHRDMDIYAQEVITRADSLVDFSKYSIVTILPPAGVKRFFTNGPVLSSGKFDKYKSSEGPIYNLTIAPESEIPMGGVKWIWLAHEVGHMLGLTHPHDYRENDKRKMSIFSLMDAGFLAPGLYGWERWRMDWIENSEIRCIDSGRNDKTVHRISPLGRNPGAKLGVIKLNEFEAIVFENRRRDEFDLLPESYEGLLVYHVNSKFGEGGITPILPRRFVIDQTKPEYNGARVVGTLRVNESVNFSNFKLEVIAEENKDLFVEVTRS